MSFYRLLCVLDAFILEICGVIVIRYMQISSPVCVLRKLSSCLASSSMTNRSVKLRKLDAMKFLKYKKIIIFIL